MELESVPTIQSKIALKRYPFCLMFQTFENRQNFILYNNGRCVFIYLFIYLFICLYICFLLRTEEIRYAINKVSTEAFQFYFRY